MYILTSTNQVPATWFAGDAGIRRLALPCATAPQGAVAIFPVSYPLASDRACSTALVALRSARSASKSAETTGASGSRSRSDASSATSVR